MDPLLGYQREERLNFLNRQQHCYFVVDANMCVCLWRFSPANQWSAEFTCHVLVTVRLAWNLDRSGTKKVSGTRYSTQWKTPQKWTVPYRTVPCSGKAPLDSIVEKAQQRLYFLRKLRKFNLPQELLIQVYSAIIESVLCIESVRTTERIIGTTLPTLQELYLSRVSRRADKITLDPSHPAHSLFELLPSGRHYRALSTRTTRHRNRTRHSFFPQAIHLMNIWQ